MMGDNPDDLPYRAEYAKSGRAKCKACKADIPKGDLRLAAMVQSPFFDGKQAHWFHCNCFFMRNRPSAVGEIAHFDSLRLGLTGFLSVYNMSFTGGKIKRRLERRLRRDPRLVPETLPLEARRRKEARGRPQGVRWWTGHCWETSGLSTPSQGRPNVGRRGVRRKSKRFVKVLYVFCIISKNFMSGRGENL